MPGDNETFCPIPGLGHCVGERCNYWDAEKGCLGTGMCFDSEVQKEAAADDLFAANIVLTCYEDFD